MAEYDTKKEQLLEELKRLSGLEPQLSEEAASDEDLRALRLLCDAARYYGSRESVILRWITGGLSEDAFHALAARLHIDMEEPLIFCYIELDSDADAEVLQVLRQALADRRGRMVLQLGEKSVAVIVPAKKKAAGEQRKIAENILSMLNTELIRARVALSRPVQHMDRLPEALRESTEAMRIGRRYYPDRLIDAADALGEGRLFYTLPCETGVDYLREILSDKFQAGESHAFEGDLLRTAEAFLANDLNIAETARTLHVHRNTLIYRLDQIRNETGLDIRRFEDAMRYRLCALVLCGSGPISS